MKILGGDFPETITFDERRLASGEAGLITGRVSNEHNDALWVRVVQRPEWLEIVPTQFGLARKETIRVDINPDLHKLPCPADARENGESIVLECHVTSGEPSKSLTETVTIPVTLIPIPDTTVKDRPACPDCQKAIDLEINRCPHQGCRVRLVWCPTCNEPNLWTDTVCRKDEKPLHTPRRQKKRLDAFEDGLTLAWAYLGASGYAAGMRWSSPTVDFGEVYAVGQNDQEATLYGFRAKAQAGSPVFEALLPDGEFLHPERSRPTVHEDSVYLGTVAGSILQFDLLSGDFCAQQSVPGRIFGSPAVGEGFVVCAASVPATGKGMLYVFDAELMSKPDAYEIGAGVDSSPVVSDGMAVVGTDSGEFVAVDLLKQGRDWRYPCDGDFNASPVVHEGTVYAATTSGHIYAFEVCNGSLLWNISLLNQYGGINCSPVLCNDRLVVVTLQGWAIMLSLTGNIIRPLQVCPGSAIRGTPAVVGGRVFLGAQDGVLYALDPGGRLQTVYEGAKGSRIENRLAADDERVYFASTNGKLYALSGRHG